MLGSCAALRKEPRAGESLAANHDCKAEAAERELSEPNHVQLGERGLAFATIIDGSMFGCAGEENDDSDTRAKSIRRLML
jgi:hypothetical protein